MRTCIFALCVLLALAGCKKEVKEPDWHIDPTQQGLDDQEPLISPLNGQRDVVLDPQISFHFTAYKKLDHLQIQLRSEPGDKPVLTLIDEDGSLGREASVSLFSPPKGVTVQRHDKSVVDSLEPNTWYVLSIYADGDRGTHGSVIRFRTRAPEKR